MVWDGECNCIYIFSLCTITAGKFKLLPFKFIFESGCVSLIQRKGRGSRGWPPEMWGGNLKEWMGTMCGRAAGDRQLRRSRVLRPSPCSAPSMTDHDRYHVSLTLIRYRCSVYCIPLSTRKQGQQERDRYYWMVNWLLDSMWQLQCYVKHPKAKTIFIHVTQISFDIHEFYLHLKCRHLNAEQLFAYRAVSMSFRSMWPTVMILRLALQRASDSPRCKWKFSREWTRPTDHRTNAQEFHPNV